MLKSIQSFWRRIASGPRERQAFALLRIGAGLFFLLQGHHKLTDPGYETALRATLQQWAAQNPFPVYKHFLLHTVIPHLHPWANWVIDGEILVGISYITGLLIPVSACIALALNLNFFLAMQHTSPTALGLNLIFMLVSLTLFWGKAGTHYGLDGILAVLQKEVRRNTSPRVHPTKPTRVKSTRTSAKAANVSPIGSRREAPANRSKAKNRIQPLLAKVTRQEKARAEKPAQLKPIAPVHKLEKRTNAEKPKPENSKPVEKLPKVHPAEPKPEKPVLKSVPAPMPADEAPPKVVKIFDHRTPDDDD